MKRHVKNYIKHHDLCLDQIWHCEKCGKQDYLQNFDLHHIKYRSHGGTDEVDNLMCLCRNCHNIIHNGK